MVVDLKKVTLNRELANGTLWVIEQIPGLVVGADQTTILRAGLFCFVFRLSVDERPLCRQTDIALMLSRH